MQTLKKEIESVIPMARQLDQRRELYYHEISIKNKWFKIEILYGENIPFEGCKLFSEEKHFIRLSVLNRETEYPFCKTKPKHKNHPLWYNILGWELVNTTEISRKSTSNTGKKPFKNRVRISEVMDISSNDTLFVELCTKFAKDDIKVLGSQKV